jgi:HD-like signal output (HDOD) protein
MKRILFVDDEQQVLDGLRDMLFKQRREWDMAFVLGGDAALAEMNDAPFDVIVSDMRMTGMDGAELLARVKQRFPATTRIVLAGHSEQQAMERAVAVAHQVLGKPCDSETLRVVIERTCTLQALLQDQAIRRVVGKIDRLPSVPSTYLELTRTIGSQDASMAEIARIVESDPAMCGKLLQIVNSAYFGLAQRMTSIRQAVAYLGLELLKGLVLNVHVFAAAQVAPSPGFSLEVLQQHSLRTGRLARQFLRDPKLADDAFTAGVLHDIGKIVLAMSLQQRFVEVTRAVIENKRPFHRVEADLLGVTHAEIGAYLLGVWGLPFAVVEAVAHHHSPGRVSGSSFEVVAVVHAAEVLSATLDPDPSEPMSDEELDVGALERAGLAGEIPRWRALAQKEIDGVRRAG